MSDLISKSELINALKVHFDSCFREDGELLYSDHICTSDDVVDLIKLVENQPTAYDIDKVVDELECDRCESCSLLEVCACSKYCGKCHEKIIEIVKQGGVSDDVCEWKMDNVGASIGCRSDLHHTGYVNEAYCPFCKKKIKVVE